MADDPSTGSDTVALLERWHGGDEAAVGELIRRDLPWIRQRVHERLGEQLRVREQTDDLVQETCMEVLRYGPRFLMSNREHFRSVLAAIVESSIRVRCRWINRQRRAVMKERPLGADSVLSLDVAAASASPSTRVGKAEEEAWVRLGIELLDGDDKEVLVMRMWEELSFPRIGRQLSMSEDAARMRFNRAVSKLGRLVIKLQTEGLASVLRR